MATKSTLELEVKSNLQEESKHAKSIKDSLEAAARTRISSAVAAAKQGVAAARSPASAYAAQKKESQEYGVSRSMGGGTGAEGRDFAKQAQGLGGLVHVYATFAANLFAVSAAFSALSKAADTTNMVKGLDQLGASSGRSLGSLAKQLSAVTDGAISLRDAMTATAQASAGGMTNSAILRMGNVAKQASQALGVAMPDAISRLSRGITKLEPELLDEIGIMVRVDTASQEYARTLGKATSALTDFEKRQGFANAVLEQGEKKFGAIKIDANPYAKILASMENLAFTGLELVNKVLSPVLTILSSSPTALAMAMAGVAAVLLKQAIPALGSFKESMKQATEASERMANIKSIAAKRGSAMQHAQNLKDAADYADTQIDAVDRVAEKIKQAGAVRAKMSKSAFLDRPIGEMDDAYFKKVEATAKGLDKRGLTESAANYREFAKVSKEALDSEEKHNMLKTQRLVQLEKEKSVLTAIGRTQVIADRANLDALSRSIKSQAAETASVHGFTAAWKEARAAIKLARSEATTKSILVPTGAFDSLGNAITKLEDITTPKMGAIRASMTTLGVGISAATSAIGSFMNFLGPWMMAIGLLIGAFQLLASWLSTNSKEADKFGSSVASANDAVDNMARTLDAISEKDPLDVFSVATTQARANALLGLSDNITTLVKDFAKLQAASSGFDNVMDALWDSIGKGSADKLSTNLAKSISATLAGLERGELRDKATATLQGILGSDIDVSSITKMEVALRKLNNQEIQNIGPGITKALQDISREANNAASNLTTVVTNFEELTKLVKANIATMQPTDFAGKVGFQMISSAGSLVTALKDPIESMKVLKSLTENMQMMSLLPPSTTDKLLESKKQLDNLNKSYGELQARELKAEKALQALKDQNKDVIKAGEIDTRGTGNTRLTQTIDTTAGAEQKTILAEIAAKKAQINVEMSAVGAKISTGLLKDFVEVGLTKLQQSLSASMQEGAITAAKGYLGVLKAAGMDTAADEGRLRQQEIGIQRKLLEANFEQARRMQELANRIEDNTLALREATNAQELVSTSELTRAKAMTEQATLASERKNLTDKKYLTSGKTGSPKDIMAMGIDPKVLSETAAFQAQEIAFRGSIAKLNGEAAAAAVQTMANVLKEEAARKNAITARASAENTAQMAKLEALQTVSGEFNKSVQQERDKLEIINLQNAAAQEQLNLYTDQKILENASNYGDKAKLLIALNEKSAAINASNAKLVIDKRNLELKQLDTIQKGEETIRVKKAAQAALELNEISAIGQAKVAQREAEVSYLTTIGALTAEDSTRRTAALALESQSIDYAKELATLDADRNSKAQVLLDLIEKQKLMRGQADPKTLEEQAALTASYDRQLTAIKLINDTKRTSIILTAEHKASEEKFAEQMSNMVGLTSDLNTAFGTVGETIGKVGEALLKMSKDDQDYLKAKTALESKLSKVTEGSDPAEVAADVKSLAKLEKQKTKDELDGYLKVAGAAKKMFGEKTAAYKAFNAVEKAIATYKLIMAAKEMAAELMVTASAVTGSATRTGAAAAEMGVSAGVAIANQGKGDPYTAFARIAAMAALMVGVISMFGGKGGGAVATPGGFTAEDRQSTQGTGMSWVDGAKVENGGGVFGDTEAKSQSIKNSIEILTATSVEGLSYSNDMVDLLISIDKGISNVSKDVYGVTGLRTGSQFGTQEGTSGSSFLGGLFGSSESTEILDSGIKFVGKFTDFMNAVASATQGYETVKTTETDSFLWMTDTSSTISTQLKELSPKLQHGIADVFNNAGDMFVASGAKLGITAQQVMSQLGNVEVDKLLSLRGLSGSALESEFNSVVSSILDDAASVLFQSLSKFREFGEGMLETAQRVLDANDKVRLAFKSIGVTLVTFTDIVPEVPAALNDAVTQMEAKVAAARVAANTMVATEVWQGAGESGGYAYTAYTENTVAIAALASAERDLAAARAEVLRASNTMTTRNLDLTNFLVQASGGLDNFLSKVKDFGSAFLTEAERLAPIRAAVDAEMYKLGRGLNFSATHTREQFKELVTTFNVVDQASAITYVKLLDVGVGFDKIATAAEAASSAASSAAKELADMTSTLEAKIFELLGMPEKALAINRAKELEALDALLRPRQLYIYALQDELALKEKIKTAYTKEAAAINTTITSLSNSIKTLKDYQTTLMAGAMSISTPEQKYAEAKAQAYQVAAIATGIATSDAEILAKQEAINKLPSVTGTFLTASKELFASSEQYTKDFGSVLGILDSTSLSLDLQRTDAQQQLDVLSTNTTILDLIKENTKTTNELLAEFLAMAGPTGTAQTNAVNSGSVAATYGALNIPGFASGGVASGLAWVGENGKELVDFKTPARVYSNKASNDLLSQADLIAEIRTLTKEVAKLRQEQKEQTGHLIATNYDANNKAANKVSAATEEATTTASWITRSAAKIA